MHDRIDEIVKSHLSEANKRRADIGFEYIGKDMKQIKITYINPNSKNLPNWAQVGKKMPTKAFIGFENKFEIYNTDGWKIKDGYVIEARKSSVDDEVTKLYVTIDKHMKNMMKDIKKNVDLSELEGTDGWEQVDTAFKLVIRKHTDEFGVSL